jgi:hypothetical protein
MLEGNLCEECKNKVEDPKARHRQTRFCGPCARSRNKKNSLDPWTPEERKVYMQRYMKVYRQRRPGLSTPYVQKYRANTKRKLAVAA